VGPAIAAAPRNTAPGPMAPRFDALWAMLDHAGGRGTNEGQENCDAGFAPKARRGLRGDCREAERAGRNAVGTIAKRSPHSKEAMLSTSIGSGATPSCWAGSCGARQGRMRRC
jgi:hypothetical protein